MESDLTLAKSDFYAEVAIQFGFPLAEAAMEAKQLFVVKSCTNQGVADFYDSHRWSFLKPFKELTLLEGERSVKLPDDFGGFEGAVYVTNDDANAFDACDFQNPAAVESMHSKYPDTTGCPRLVAVRQLKGTTANESDRQDLYVFPEADAEYTLKFQYFIRPNCLTDQHPYAYGGREHTQTILAACLAAKEQKFDKIMDGPDFVRFMRRLAISIEQDNRKKSKLLSMARPSSDDYEGAIRQFDPVTINSIVYD